jgi:hypothetical protein
VSVKLDIIQSSKWVDKVLEVLNAILALHHFASLVFKLLQLNVKAALTVLLPMLMETVHA